MNDTNHADTEFRPITAKELASFISIYRQSLGWTQETLAEISGLTVRTVQRVEKGEPSSIDTRRAIARAFQVEDIDAFNKPCAFKSPEAIKRDADALKRSHMTIPVSVATTGKQLADLAEKSQASCYQLPDGVDGQITEIVAYLFDSMRDYGEVDDCYSLSDKLKVHADFTDRLTELSRHGYSICFALRRTKISNKAWVDTTPMAIGIAYAFLTERGKEPKMVAVERALNCSF